LFVEKVNIYGYNFAFMTCFSSNKPALIRFFVDELIKHAHNSIKDGHKLMKQTVYPIKGRFIRNILFLSENPRMVTKKIFGGSLADKWWHLHP